MRNLSDTAKAILAGAMIPVRVLVRAVLPSGTFGASDATPGDDVAWNDLDYRAIGSALGVEVAPSSLQTLPQASTVRFSGTDPVIFADFFGEAYRNAPAAISLLLLDPATGAPAEEIPVVSGHLDTAALDEGKQDPRAPEKPAVSTLTMTVAPLSSDLARAGTRTSTDADQRTYRDVSDGFFKDVGLVAKGQIAWGRTGATSPGQILVQSGT